ncbi:MAG: NAD(P)-dependent oxidoreductase [Caldilineaceae bacterium SB0670_bin_27]|uniref:NAD(P)-dependent oxidoreductase n=1 Tax=Caldilineaceae bacterium SB0664_bin_27 TaxID=2605260 RepID=A0A6B0YP95_9CHLR|nr:NAD(P)-dependent oxidoreductase [Caldilineaceae bacterium SB0664_bin_27]MYJ77902.1 NAD(P)-dependent oxidoreductase [Caldilineaceae bacterium SB0670_bin_27]
MSDKRRVVITGASGYIASLLLPVFRERYDLTLLDIRNLDGDGNQVEGVQIADLTQRDRDSYRHHFSGADAVVHLGFTRAEDKSDPIQDFYAELANVEMAFHVYQTAQEEGVGRVVVASSNHAADYYEPLILDKKWDVVTPEMRPFSDNFYGWAKEAYEHLGFVFAVGRMQFWGVGVEEASPQPLENVQVRIGGPREDDLERIEPGDLRRMVRGLAVYISQRDLQQLFIKSIETEDIGDEQDVPFQVFYGISGNSQGFWSIVNARKVIGYEPEDNSEYRFSDQIHRHIKAAKDV